MQTTEKSGIVRPFGINTNATKRSNSHTSSALTPRRFKKFSINQTWLPLKNNTTDFDCLFPENNSKDVKKIKFATHPYHFWGLALMFCAGASVFVYALSSTSNFRFEKGFWWQYVIIFFLYLASALFFFLPRVEVFRMDKNRIAVSTPKTYQYIFSLSKKIDIERKISEISAIVVEESGERIGEVDTRLYNIRFEFHDGTNIALLEHYSKRVAIRRCRSLNFLYAAYAPPSPVKSPNSPKKKFFAPSEPVAE